MNRNNPEKLTDSIKRVLSDHEEPYVLGSWERFQQHQNRKKRTATLKKSLAIAATVLIAFSSFFLWENGETQFPEQLILEEPITVKPVPPRPSVNREERFTFEAKELKNEIDHIEDSASDDLTHHEKEPGLFSHSSSPDLQKILLPATWQAVNIISDTTEKHRRDIFTSAGELTLMNDSPVVRDRDINPVKSSLRDKRFLFSFAYSPLMNVHDSKTDWGTGGGFYTDWNLSRKTSISSGIFIAQNQLKYDAEYGRTMKAGDDQTLATMQGDLAYMQVDLISMEIPINFRYYISDQLSITAGISSVAYLQEEYDYTFEYQQQIQVFNNQETTSLEPVTRVVTLTDSQKQTEPSFSGLDLAGFYTFSIAYQVEIPRQPIFSLEPYIKVPTGQLTSRDIKYTTSGLQLKIIF